MRGKENMTERLFVLCDIFPLGETYEKGFLYFAMSMSPAFDSGIVNGIESVRSYLAPWEWTIDEISVQPFDEDHLPNSTDPRLDSVKAQRLKPPAVSQEMFKIWCEKLKGLRQKTFFDRGFDPAQFIYTPAPNPVEMEIGENDKPNTMSWHGALMYLSSLPYPLPHVANLVHFFRIPVPEGKPYTKIAAAPSFTVNGTVQGLQKTINVDANFFFTWASDTVNDLSTKSYGRLCAATAPKSFEGADLVSGWFTDNAPSRVLASNWMAGLRDKVCQLFDLPQLLLQLHQLVPQPELSFAEGCFISLADEFGLGFVDAKGLLPTIYSVNMLIINSINEEGHGISDDLSRKILIALSDYWKTKASTFDDWKKLICEALKLTDEFQHHSVQFVQSVHEQLTKNENLAGLFAFYWNAALTLSTDKDINKFWNPDVENVLAVVLRRLSLKRRRENDLVEMFWPYITKLSDTSGLDLTNVKWWDGLSDLKQRVMKLPSEQQALLGSIVGALRSYIGSRLAKGKSVPFADSLPGSQKKDFFATLLQSDDFNKAFLQHVITYCLEHILSEAVPLDHNAPVATTPESLNLVVDSFSGKVSSELEDVRRYVNGVGILLRDAVTTGGVKKNWNCLNLSDIVIEDDKPQSTSKVLQRAGIVPLTVQENDGLRQSLVTYSNRPMAGINPDGLAQSQTFEGDQASSLLPAMFKLNNAYRKDGVEPKLPRLSYGTTYDARAFVVRKGGALPFSLIPKAPLDGEIKHGYPAALADDLSDTTIGEAGANQKAAYERRFPFGLVRLFDTQTTGDKPQELKFPKLPDNVYPLAASLIAGAARSSKHLVLLVTKEDQPKSIGGCTSFIFECRPPACDFAIWERSPKIKPEILKDVFLYSHEHREKALRGTATPQVPKDFLDDPLVDALHFRLRDSDDLYQDLQVFCRPKDSKGLDSVFRKPYSVSVVTSALGEKPKIELKPKSETSKLAGVIEISLPEGQVFDLEIRPSSMDQKPAVLHDVLRKDTQKHTEEGQLYWLGEAETISFEVATRQLPSPLELNEILSASLTPATVGLPPSVMEFSISPNPKTVAMQKFANTDFVSRVELKIQRWRWQGRPLPQDVDFAGKNSPIATNKWNEFKHLDGALFGERFDDDCRLHESRVDFAAKKESHILLRQDLSNDLASHYYRFGLKCFSRYEGLFPDVSEDSLRSGDQNELNWMRFAVPCRHRGTVKAPSIRMILPLTEAPSKLNSLASVIPAAGLLCVIDEPWFEVGGLGEKLVVEIEQAKTPDSGENRNQIGHDPILSMNPQQKITLANVVGPAGYTFDTDTLSPKLTKCSFVISPPTSADEDNAGQAWNFAKLRFRRLLANVLTQSELISSNPGKQTGIAHVTLQSEPTPGVWCQFLPSASHFHWQDSAGDMDPFVAAVSSLQLAEITNAEGYRLCLTYPDAGHVVVKPTEDPDTNPLSKSIFRHCAVITQVVSDVFGAKTSESFFGIFSFNEDGSLKQIYPSTATPRILNTKLRARILELQERAEDRNKQLSDDELIKQILRLRFKDSTEEPIEDALARPVRISEPCELASVDPNFAQQLPSGLFSDLKTVVRSVSNMYLDSRARVCIGRGHVVEREEDATNLPLRNKSDHSDTSVVTRRFNWRNIQQNPVESSTEAGASKLTNSILEQSVIDALLYFDLRSAQKTLTDLYPNFSEFPSNARAALIEMMLELGLRRYRTYKKFNAAIKSADWSTAAIESHRPGVAPQRNEYVKNLLQNLHSEWTGLAN